MIYFRRHAINIGNELLDFKHLWTTDADRYVLVQVYSSDSDSTVIVEEATKMAIVIEDDDVAAQVIERMKAAAVRVVNGLV